MAEQIIIGKLSQQELLDSKAISSRGSSTRSDYLITEYRPFIGALGPILFTPFSSFVVPVLKPFVVVSKHTIVKFWVKFWSVRVVRIGYRPYLKPAKSYVNRWCLACVLKDNDDLMASSVHAKGFYTYPSSLVQTRSLYAGVQGTLSSDLNRADGIFGSFRHALEFIYSKFCLGIDSIGTRRKISGSRSVLSGGRRLKVSSLNEFVDFLRRCAIVFPRYIHLEDSSPSSKESSHSDDAASENQRFIVKRGLFPSLKEGHIQCVSGLIGGLTG